LSRLLSASRGRSGAAPSPDPWWNPEGEPVCDGPGGMVENPGPTGGI
jgi:hypothetical protein